MQIFKLLDQNILKTKCHNKSFVFLCEFSFSIVATDVLKKYYINKRNLIVQNIIIIEKPW